ncbi:hypothetical protein F2P81_025683 [Scophthalmus maximus]|uniref:Uncharacterized protein n=1 Tax=Scophthalmus maximus TaxID=52904 RepID=A0A6A4RU28_SCOMX|nr:hypothetical protein F2P81_025683 [Scophthalmus maximus]
MNASVIIPAFIPRPLTKDRLNPSRTTVSGLEAFAVNNQTDLCEKRHQTCGEDAKRFLEVSADKSRYRMEQDRTCGGT